MRFEGWGEGEEWVRKIVIITTMMAERTMVVDFWGEVGKGLVVW